jgi:hypothetical protein
MATSFVLVHSPALGPRTWQPVVRRLTELGWPATVPSLLHVGHQGPPFWPWVVDAVHAGLGTPGWWDEEDVAPLFPDQPTRRAVTEEQPRLPLAYYEASVPIPAGWDVRPCAYLLFGPPYDEAASQAHAQGWIVDRLPGGHLHQLVDPDGVARLLLAMADQMRVTKP